MKTRMCWMVTLAGLAWMTSGCATLDLPFAQRMPQASAKNPVVQVVCMWEASEGRDPEGAPCRGFAGQILFLGNKGGTPVAVEGEVIVYVFDDIGTEAEQAVPIHQFRFDAKAWNRHMKVGTLGPSYHCFIPYTRRGSHEANCTLRLRFTPTEGQPLTSDASHLTLEGRTRMTAAEQPYVSENTLAYQTSRPAPRRLPKTTTIPLVDRGVQTAGWTDAATTDDQGVVPAGYATSAPGAPASSEDRLRQILEAHKQAHPAQVPAAPTESPRLKLKGS